MQINKNNSIKKYHKILRNQVIIQILLKIKILNFRKFHKMNIKNRIEIEIEIEIEIN